MNKKLFQSIGSVLAGFFTVVVLSVATDLILEGIGFFPPPEEGLFDTWLLMIALLYRTIYAGIGGYVTAVFSPDDHMRHVLILNCIGIMIGTLGVVAGWNLSQHWYPITLVFTSAVGVWIGGKLKTART